MSYSVVIPTLGDRATLTRLFESIERQTRQPDEVIVVSPSRHSYVSNGSRLVLAPANLPSQRSAGVRVASAPVILFVDDDMVLADDFAAELCAVWERRGLWALSGVAGSIVNESNGPRWRRILRASAGLSHAALFARQTTIMASGHVAFVGWPREERAVRFVRGGCMSFRRDLLLIDPPDERFEGYVYGEDLDLAARMSRHAPLIHTPRAICFHLPVGTGLSTGADNAYRRSRMFALYRGYHRRPGLLGKLAWEWANVTEGATVGVRALRARDTAQVVAYARGLAATRAQLRRERREIVTSHPPGQQAVQPDDDVRSAPR